jgi:hypothetical protein
VGLPGWLVALLAGLEHDHYVLMQHVVVFDVGAHRQRRGLRAAVEEDRGARDARTRVLVLVQLVDERTERALRPLAFAGDDPRSSICPSIVQRNGADQGATTRAARPWAASSATVWASSTDGAATQTADTPTSVNAAEGSTGPARLDLRHRSPAVPGCLDAEDPGGIGDLVRHPPHRGLEVLGVDVRRAGVPVPERLDQNEQVGVVNAP